MDIFDLLNLVCGLALFLFGMSYMGDGLETCAGSRLQEILMRLTSSPVKGFFLGFVVTAIIQSSSATTVMVVGFVNSGLMTLQQAVGLIMGANVGTTVTAWLISLTSIDGASFFIQLLKPDSWMPILAIIGVYFMCFDKSGKRKGVAAILLGFSILMVGMDIMSSSVEGLKDVPEFTQAFTLFSNPLLGILVGAVLTAIIQSSSASLGILQALSTTGIITFETAIPIILGMNIGTTVTALLSSVNTNRDARRAAFVHLYINILSTVIFMVPYSVIRYTVGMPVLSGTVGPLSIAIFNTIFKLGCAIILLPFTNGLVKLACLTVPDGKSGEAEEQSLLDDRLMTTPAVALAQAQRLTVDTALMAQESFNQAVTLLEHWDDKVAEKVREMEKTIDKYEDALGTYLVKLSNLTLTEGENRSLTIMLHSISDFERISDHAVGILISAHSATQKHNVLSDSAKQELKQMAKAVSEALSLCIASFSTKNLDAARRVEPLEEVVDRLAEHLRTHHIDRLRAGKCSVESGFIFTDLISNFRRVSDHCSNVAACIIELQNNTYDTHKYLHSVHHSGDASYVADYEYFLDKYSV